MNSSVNSELTSDLLIVDDTLDNVRLLSDILTNAGFTVRKAISGEMALTAVQASLPSLILLDINMPEMDGFEVCRQLKANPHTQEIPIIFLSASDMTHHKVEAFKMGGADYVTKPFQAEEVIARIRHQLLIAHLKKDLQHKNKNLETTLSKLKETQVELIQKEKMVGLSQLIAGIAHEINNPISFIVGNLNPAKQYFSDLMDIIKLYQQRFPTPGKDIEKAISRADLDFISQDFSEVLKSMETGTARIRRIVQSLQTFSQQGNSAIKTIDIHETLDNILLLTQPRLRGEGSRPSIQVACDYGQVPAITCDARLINQAILHILDNAVDAINGFWDELTTNNGQAVTFWEPAITIATTTPKPGWVAIKIRDNGIGIAEEQQSRVFDPFFTTKPIGQGEGLGLSITYQIVVDKHKGNLFVQSTPKHGSEFVVELPVEMPQS